MNITDAQWREVHRLLLELVEFNDRRLNEVRDLIREIEAANGTKTYSVVVRWLDAKNPYPRVVDNPAMWPPELKAALTSQSPIHRDDIEAFVFAKTPRPIAIYVTRDPAGEVGWMKLEDWG